VKGSGLEVSIDCLQSCVVGAQGFQPQSRIRKDPGVSNDGATCYSAGFGETRAVVTGMALQRRLHRVSDEGVSGAR
jgi:hypothetical protein